MSQRKAVPILIISLAWLFLMGWASVDIAPSEWLVLEKDGVPARCWRSVDPASVVSGARPDCTGGLAAYQARSSSISLSPDGAILLVVNPDSNSLTLVDLGAPATSDELSVGVDPRAVAVSPDGATGYVANQGSDSLSVVDLAARSVDADLSVGDRPVGVAVSPDGRFVAVAELGDDRVRFLDADTLATLSTVAVADRPHGLAFTPDGRRLLVTHLLSGDVTVLAVQPFALYLPLILRPW